MKEPVLISNPAPKPQRIYSIVDLQEHDMDNILVALRLLLDKLNKKSIQRIQCEELHHTLKGQLHLHRKAATAK